MKKTKMVNIAREKLEWLFGETERIIKAARPMPPVFYNPDGSGNYQGAWGRDFDYIVGNVPELVPANEIKTIYYSFLRAQRADGGLPVSLSREGIPGYNTVGSTEFTDSDASQFIVKIAYDYYKYTGDIELFASTIVRLKKAMDFVPRNSLGLVWIDPDNPHTGYGFTDLVVKTGNELFCSLLYWETCRLMADIYKKMGEKEMVAVFQKRAHRIETNIHVLWSDKLGAFFASDSEQKIDIWGNAYLVYIGFPVKDKLNKILDFLVSNYKRYTYCGQVRHLLEGEYWSRLIYDVPRDTYQLGAYWGVASGWVAYALNLRDTKLASEMLNALIDDYQQRGVYECIHHHYTKVKDYVASITNPVGAIKRMLGITNICKRA